MAEKYGFLKIGEANAAIEKLTKERDDLKARAEAAESNAEEIAKQAEQSRKESDSASSIQKLLDDEKAAHSTTKQKLEKAESDLKASIAAQSDFDKKVELAASAKAQQINAAIGVPPIISTPAANPADAKKERNFKAEVKPLSGAERLALERK